MTSLAALRAKCDVKSDPRFPIRSWLNTAARTYDAAEQADRKGQDMEAAYVGYRRFANILKCVLEHPEYKTMTSSGSKGPDYQTYAKLKAKVVPATLRVREIEGILEEALKKREASTASTSNPRGTGTEASVPSSVESISAIGFDDEAMQSPIAPSSSSAPSSAAAGYGSRPHAVSSASRGGPPPIQPKPASMAGSPTSPARSHRISGNLAARMQMLYNAGMQGAGEHAGMSPTSPLSSAVESQDESNSPVPSGSGLKRSPALLHQSSGQAAPRAGEGIVNGNGVRRRAPSDQDYSHGTSSADRHPMRNSLQASPSSSTGQLPISPDLRASGSSLSPSQAEDQTIADSERPDSAPPAMVNGAQPASGPATTQHDILSIDDDEQQSGSSSMAIAANLKTRSLSTSGGTRPSDSPQESEEDQLAARFAALLRPKMSTHDTYEDFSDRFPDVNESGFDILPSSSVSTGMDATSQSSQPDRGSGIPKPFHPAPQSTSGMPSISSNGMQRKASMSSLHTQSTGGSGKGINGYTPAQLQHAAQSKPPPRAPPGTKGSSRPPLPPTPAAPSLPNTNSTTLSPSDLWAYLDPSNPSSPSILLLDVRNRSDHNQARIRTTGKTHDSCIEPFTLTANSTAGSIENSLIVGPDAEKEAFENRANYDLIVVYDKDTRALPSRRGGGFRNTPLPSSMAGSSQLNGVDGSVTREAKTLAILLSAIYEFNFSDEGKRLKRSPLLLVGGMDAWQKAIGEKGIERSQVTDAGQGDRISSSAEHAQSRQDSGDVKRQHRKMVIPGDGYAPTAPLPSSTPISPLPLHQPNNTPNSTLPYLDETSSAATSSATRSEKERLEHQHVHEAQQAQGRTGGYYVGGAQNSAHTNGGPAYSPSYSMSNSQPPPPGYPSYPNPAVTLPPVAVHRTGPASPYEVYPSTPSLHQSMYAGNTPSLQSSQSRRNDYFDGSQPQHQGYPREYSSQSAAYSGAPQRPIDYPSLRNRVPQSNGTPPRPSGVPAPATAFSSNVQQPDSITGGLVKPPPPALARAPSTPAFQLFQSASYLSNPSTGMFPKQLTAMGDGVVGLTGLKNLGNTCYMNSMVQCMSATIPLARFLKEGAYKRAINTTNPLGTKGALADAVAQLVQTLWSQQYSFLAPVTFREAICRFAPQFKGTSQHDSQELLSYLLDGLHEDLNMVAVKPKPVEFTKEREAELESLPTQIAAEREWNIYLRRDDSIIVRLFQGQYKSQLKCLTCGQTSTTYNTFMYLSLPLPSGKSIPKVTLQQCIDIFVKPEILEGDDAWNCPKCKKPRRASKALTISRLPPVLLIHFKRFSFQGPFTDKIDTTVQFPVRGLDLSPYVPGPLDPALSAKYATLVGGHGLESQGSPIYDLHAISNHFGSLTSGHYTAFVKSRGRWNELNDSKIIPIDESHVSAAGRSAYTLWYSKRP